MDRLLNAKQVAGIIGYKDMARVRKIIRECVHLENPLRVSESALEAWINQKMYRPVMEAQAEVVDRIPRRRGGKLI